MAGGLGWLWTVVGGRLHWSWVIVCSGFFELGFSVVVDSLWGGCGFQCCGGGFAVDFLLGFFYLSFVALGLAGFWYGFLLAC